MNIDVVIVTFNSASHLPRVLGGLPDGADIFVVDNASSDNSADVAAAHGATVVRGQVNAGFAAACNRGAALGNAKTILFLNPDAVITADALELLVREMDDDVTVGVGSPRLLNPDGSRQRTQWPYPSAAGAWREALGFASKVEESNDGFVVGACFAVRREAFEAVGGFDERFWLYGEEADLCKRIEDAGWAVRRFPSVTATHIGGASGGEDPAQSRLVLEHFQRGGEHFVEKHEGRGALLAYRAANLTGSLGRGLLGVGQRSAEHRRRAVRLGRTLAENPSRVDLDSPASTAPTKGLVVCSLEAWDEVWRRNQFFVRELLESDPDLRVLFVEPAFDVVHERRQRSSRRRRPGLRPVEADGRIVRFEPVKWLPRRLGGAADNWRDDQVLDAVRKLGFVDPTLWVNDPSYATLADRVAWPAVYDITDDWTRVADHAEAAKTREWEARLFVRCEAVTVCSTDLAASRSKLRDDIVLIPNAVDARAMQTPRARPVDLPDAPTVVYVGTLQPQRLDVDLIARVARELDASVVLVGPDALDEASRGTLDAAGVIRLGARRYEDVPAYLQHADVMVVPHVVSPFTESLDPIKLYESLAVGTPTVSTPVAGFRDAGPPVRVADAESFVDEVRTVLVERPDPAPQEVPSWSDRASAFAEVLGDVAEDADTPATRVVFFDHCAKRSGGELAMLRLIPALDGVDAHVILGQHGALEELLDDAGITNEVMEIDGELNGMSKDSVGSVTLPIRAGLLTVKSVWQLRHRLRDLRPDLVHTNSLKAGLIGSLAARAAGVPVVWHVHDRIAEDYLPARAVKLMRAAIRLLPDAVIANSQATADTLPGVANLSVVGNVAPWLDAPVPERATGDAPLRVVMLGRLTPWKGQHVFLDAFARAFADGSAHAVVAGEALFGEEDHAEQLRAQVVELGIGDAVEFLGHVDDPRALLESADIVVHASTLPEPFGQVIVEALALGRAVIASDAGGAAEIVTDGVDGLLTEPGDADQLAGALTRLAADPDLRVQLGAAGQKRARDFAPDRIGRDASAVYASVRSVERSERGDDDPGERHHRGDHPDQL